MQREALVRPLTGCWLATRASFNEVLDSAAGVHIPALRVRLDYGQQLVSDVISDRKRLVRSPDQAFHSERCQPWYELGVATHRGTDHDLYVVFA